jgi:hypothetical protein
VASDEFSPRANRLFLSISSAGIALVLIATLLIFLFSPIYDFFYKLIDQSVLRPERYFLPDTPFFLPLLPLLLFTFVTLGLSIIVFLTLKADQANEFYRAGITKWVGIFISIYISIASSGILLIIAWNFSKDAFHQTLEWCAELRNLPYAWIPFSMLNFSGLYMLLLRGHWSILSPNGFGEAAAALFVMCALLIIPFYWLADVVASFMFYFVLENVVSGPFNPLFKMLGLVVIFSATFFIPAFAIVQLARYVHHKIRRR